MYLDYFGLSEEPFSMTPDPRFIFWSRHHEAATESLLYGIHQRKGFLLLTGEIGTGKTTLCRELMNRLGEGTDISVILNPLLSVTGLLKSINADFGNQVKIRTVEDQLKALNEFLLSRVGNGRNAVVLIDEAQNLSVEALEMIRLLSNLETDKQKLLQLLLVGQPELDATLQSYCLRQLNQRITVRQHLGQLSLEETRDYIIHRISIAGGAGRIEFKNNALKLVHVYTQGFPRLTNALCDRVLLAAYANRTRTIDKNLVRESIIDLNPQARQGWWRLRTCLSF